MQALRVSRGIALLFPRTFGTRWGWGGQPHAWAASTPGKDLVPIVQEAGWATGPVWMGGKSRPHRDSIPDCPACSQSLYWLSYPAHLLLCYTAELFCGSEHLTTWMFVFVSVQVYELGVREGLFLSKYQRSLYNVDRLQGQPWWTPEETTYSKYFKWVFMFSLLDCHQRDLGACHQHLSRIRDF